MMQELSELATLVKKGEEDEAAEMARQIISSVKPKIIVNAMTCAMRELGMQFEKQEIFIPELLIAADALLAVMGVIEPYVEHSREKQRTVVIGTVAGDIHEIGKNIVSIVCKAEGFNVIDLGTDVPAQEFVDVAVKHGAEVIGLSTLMTTTMEVQREVIERLVSENIRERYKVLIGGAPTSQKWADEIDADAYCEDAFKGAAYINSLS